MANSLKGVTDFSTYISGNDAPIVVGGQAVNLWCLITENLAPEIFQYLIPFAPFVSKDCDVFGDRTLLNKLKFRTHLACIEYKFANRTCLVGYLYDAEDPEKKPFIEVLEHVKGLTRKEIGDGQPVVLDQVAYRTLNPIQLMQAKLANVVEISQENRQDVRHVKMLVYCIRAYITYAHNTTDASQHESVKFLKQMLNHCLRIICSENAIKVASMQAVNFRTCFPEEILRTSPIEAVQNFWKHQISNREIPGQDLPAIPSA